MSSFRAAVSSGIRNFAALDGRARRSQFWWWMLLTLIAQVFATVIDALAGGELFGDGPVTLVTWLAFLVPTTTFSVRRLHDIDLSGWWVLVAGIPCGGLVLLVWLTRSGTPAENRFGPVPAG